MHCCPPRENEPTNIKDGRLVGFTDEILANMFEVARELCGSKFELKVNDVRFVGHPVSLEPSKGQLQNMFAIHFMFNLFLILFKILLRIRIVLEPNK